MVIERRQAALGLFFVTFLWGGTFVWMKQAMNSLDQELVEYSTAGVVGVIVASRFLIAFVALLPFSSKARSALTSKEDWKGGLVLGSLMLLGFVLQMIGIDSVSPSVSAFLTSLYVVFTAILSVKISDRKPTRMMVAGVALATFGAGFIDGPPHIVWGIGEILTVLCAFFFALHIIYTDKITKKFNLGAGLWNSSDSVLDNISQPDDFIQDSTKIDEIGIGKDILVIKLRKEMHQAAERLDFERAASIRDRIYQIENATD